MNGFERLVVVSSAGWLAKDFAAPGIIEVVPEVGFDLPRFNPKDTAWWCSGSYAARAAATGLKLPFLSAGPHWMDTLPHDWRKRNVTSMRVSDVVDRFHGGFIKPAEIKVSTLPAKVYLDDERSRAVDSFLHDVKEAGLPADSWLTVSEPVEFVREYRCFVSNGEVVAATPYLLHGVTWDGLAPDADPEGRFDATAFVNELLIRLGPLQQPPGFVVDTGVDVDGNWAIIEANASWSSNPYNADMTGVIESVLSSHDVNRQYPQWQWKIDPYHQKNARKLHWKD